MFPLRRRCESPDYLIEIQFLAVSAFRMYPRTWPGSDSSLYRFKNGGLLRV